jgi:hypothetical protein
VGKREAEGGDEIEVKVVRRASVWDVRRRRWAGRSRRGIYQPQPR